MYFELETPESGRKVYKTIMDFTYIMGFTSKIQHNPTSALRMLWVGQLHRNDGEKIPKSHPPRTTWRFVSLLAVGATDQELESKSTLRHDALSVYMSVFIVLSYSYTMRMCVLKPSYTIHLNKK